MKCTPTTLDGINFTKDYEKDSYNKIKKIIEKNIDDKNILTTVEKHSYF